MRSNCAQTVLELSKHPTAVHPITGALPEPEHVFSDALIWNLANIPITDNGSEISADTRSNIQL